MAKKRGVQRGVWYKYDEFEPAKNKIVDIWANGRRYADYILRKNYNGIDGNDFFDPYRSGVCCIHNATHWIWPTIPEDN